MTLANGWRLCATAACLTAACFACGNDSNMRAVGGSGTPSPSTPGPTGSGATGTSGGGSDAASGVAPPPATCNPPIEPEDASHPTAVVGSGNASSCTEAALAGAVSAGGVITFDCGGPATVALTHTIDLPIDNDTVLDGGGIITLDGGGVTRILDFNSPNYRATKTKVTLQHMTLAHGKATGTLLAAAPAPCSQGYDLDGSGAAILVRDGILHVFDVTFEDNHAASPGPDVGGGGIYANGSLEVVVIGSRFTGNSASNGGAVGLLNSDLTLVNDLFSNNQATGSGENYIDATCAVGGGESGNGGNAGAVGIDGGSDGTVTICGSTFATNRAGALGGALGRTPDAAPQIMNIDRTTFDGNSAFTGGGAMYIHNSTLNITASTLSNNTAPGAGGVQSDATTIAFVNDTFSGNAATAGLGGAMSLFGDGGTIQNCTFADNHADGGSGLFGAAIAGNTALTISNTIFSNNTSMDCGAPMACQDGTSPGQSNLQWPKAHRVCTADDPPCAAGTTFAAPLLSALAANGGPTQTMIPQAGSPAIGMGTTCPSADQLGVTRKPAGCTLGAVEVP
jgi:predicted outer membrane repeat protein